MTPRARTPEHAPSQRCPGRSALVPRRSPQRGGIISKLIALIFLVVFCLLLYVVRRPILRAAGEFWVVDEAPQPADVIVVLSDDTYYAERAEHAAQLFRAGWAPRVVASGRMLRPYAGIAELMRRDLTLRGVPEDAVVPLPHRAANTREEAATIRGLLEQRGWRRVILVTSNFHTRRARYIFRHILPKSFQFWTVAAADSAYNPQKWWESRSGVKLFFYEALGSLVAVWELRNVDPPQSVLLPGLDPSRTSPLILMPNKRPLLPDLVYSLLHPVL